MEHALLSVLLQFAGFLDDYQGQELDLHALVRQQETMLATFEDLDDDDRRDLVDKLTELGEELGGDAPDRVAELLTGLDLVEEDEI